METSVNWLAILAAAISSFVVGALWYSPWLVGKAWMKENNFKMQDMKGGNPLLMYGLTFVLSFFIATNLAFFFGTEIDLKIGMVYGGLAGFGWASMALATIYIFERKTLRLWLIHAGYITIQFVVMGAILGAWH
ncbi:MAG: DUF1761 domain-containing protein [Bacteroidales bacterium]|nr:DUF1761 domain-containing protein [Bacteroidales bacterium]